MLNGLYVATSGLLMQEERVSVITNNIANINTNGFKKELAVFSDYRPVDERKPQDIIQKSYYNRAINSVVKLDDIKTDFEQGHMKYTDNKLDLALENPNNFFSVETPFGLRFTRDGSLSLNSNGELVTKDGFNLIDRTTGAPIVIPPNATDIQITGDGTVNVNNLPIGQLSVVGFEDMEKLQKIGRNLYTAVDTLPETPADPGVLQGYIESSNVDPIMEMVRMIEAMRGFEMYQKVVHTYDQLNDKAVNTIASV